MTARELLDRLQGVRQSGNGWIARCSAHDDRKASLSIREQNGRILLFCHAGCSTEAVIAALGLEMRDLFTDSESPPRIVATYPYVDEIGKPLFEVVRYEPKGFRQRRPDGRGGWIWNLNGVRRLLYQLPQILAADLVLVVEGEKDADAAGRLGYVATCNSGGAGKWCDRIGKPYAEYTRPLHHKQVSIIADADEAGGRHAQQVAASLHLQAREVKLLEMPGAKDLSEWVARGGTAEQLLELIRNTPIWQATRTPTPWDAAEHIATFFQSGDDGAEFLDPDRRIIVRSCITELFSPRGLGKSLYALWLGIQSAERGLRVFLIDRDNPRHTLRSRLKSFGVSADLGTLVVITREKCPPLTDAAAWADFPYHDYDVVIIDSLDSAAEGVGEQDSGKPSRAIAPLLDIARREHGPAVLVLGNTVKSAQHSRGSGVIEDRADIVFEVRDATNLHPTGSKAWVEELPPCDASSWASRASRRKQRTKYRLAFVASKFRIGQEPEPFILEIDMSREPWTISDVSGQVNLESAETQRQRAAEKEARVNAAVEKLKAEISRRAASGEAPLRKRQDTEPFLMALGLNRSEARSLLADRDGTDWVLRPNTQDGRTIHVLPGDKNPRVGHNSPPTEAAKNGPSGDAECGRGLFMRVATSAPTEPLAESGDIEPQNVADPAIFLLPATDDGHGLLAAQVPPADADYAQRLQACLALINSPDYPAGMVPWLDEAYPRLYAELTSRLPDDIHRLWEAHAPVEQFEGALNRLLGPHRQACALYRAHLSAKGNDRRQPEQKLEAQP